jgi:glutaminase
MAFLFIRAWLRDIDLNIADYDGRTALHLAAAEGHFDAVKFLLNVAQVNPEALDRYSTIKS